MPLPGPCTQRWPGPVARHAVQADYPRLPAKILDRVQPKTGPTVLCVRSQLWGYLVIDGVEHGRDEVPALGCPGLAAHSGRPEGVAHHVPADLGVAALPGPAGKTVGRQFCQGAAQRVPCAPTRLLNDTGLTAWAGGRAGAGFPRFEVWHSGMACAGWQQGAGEGPSGRALGTGKHSAASWQTKQWLHQSG